MGHSTNCSNQGTLPTPRRVEPEKGSSPWANAYAGHAMNHTCWPGSKQAQRTVEAAPSLHAFHHNTNAGTLKAPRTASCVPKQRTHGGMRSGGPRLGASGASLSGGSSATSRESSAMTPEAVACSRAHLHAARRTSRRNHGRVVAVAWTPVPPAVDLASSLAAAEISPLAIGDAGRRDPHECSHLGRAGGTWT